VAATAEFVVVEDEVNPAIAMALKSGLQVVGLGPRLTAQPALLGLNLSAEGASRSLATVLRKTLDEIHRVRIDPKTSSEHVEPHTVPEKNAIDAPPLNDILSMHGASVNGIFRAAIGRAAILNGTPLGREMGVRTTVTVFDTNDRAFLDAEIVATGDELRILLALTARNLAITSIRNHLIGERPQMLFIRVWGQGYASQLVKALRYALDVQVGPITPGD
jgi:hypothetical protein